MGLIATKPYDPKLHLHPRNSCSVPMCGGEPSFSLLFQTRTGKLNTRAVCAEHERHYIPKTTQKVNHDWLAGWNGSVPAKGDAE